MATDIYKGFRNPISGETFRCISSTEESFTMQWTVQPKGYVPLEHIHPNQDEIFHVKSGEVRLVIEGKEEIAKAGETITVPKGKAHIAYNNKSEVLDCVVEYKPRLDFATLFQCIGGLTLDNDYDEKGALHFTKMGYFTARMKAKCLIVPTSIPLPMVRLGLLVFLLIGTIRGWNKLFLKYTE